MDAGDGSSASSLQPPVRVFLGSLECIVEAFQSRSESIKCVTPSLDDQHMHFTDVPLPVSVVTLMPNGTYAPAGVTAGSTPTFRFSSAATPELAAVIPQVAGPSEVLRIHAWSCSGVVEAEPIELVSVQSSETPVSQGSDRDGAVNSIVDDPAEAWAAICEPFPPHNVREELQRATQLEAEQALANIEGGPETVGARGLYGIFFANPDPSSVSSRSFNNIQGMKEFLVNNDVATANRYLIAPSPYLPWDTYWADRRSPYLVQLSGWLYIEQPGAYRFFLACYDHCYAQIGDRIVEDSAGRQVAGWHHHHRITTPEITLPTGWQPVKIVHVCLLHHAGHSALELKYDGPEQTGFQIIPQRLLRAGVSQATVDGLNHDADRQIVGRSQESLTPARQIDAGNRANSATCPGGTRAMYVEFFCKVPSDMQPGFYNLKFHDYHYGQSIEGRSAQWDAGMGAKKATVRIVPKVTSVEEVAGGGLHIRGRGLDELDILSGNGTAQYGNLEYAAVNGSQDYIDLQPVGPVSNASRPAAGSIHTLGPRGLLREFWFSNMWPDELDALGQTPSIERSAELITPIEDASGGAQGFAERLTGVLVPPMTGDCRFRLQGTKRHHHDTDNDARLYLGTSPLSLLAAGGEDTSRPVPIMYWPGKVFQGAPAEPIDLATEGYEGFFGGAWSIAATVTFASDAGTGSLFEFGKVDGNRIGVTYTSTTLTFRLCQGTRCWDRSVNQIDAGNEHQWMFGVSSLGKMMIIRDGSLLESVRAVVVPSQSRPYFHLWMGRGVSDMRTFKGEIKDVKVFNTMALWGDAFGPTARAPPAPPSPPARRAPYYEVANVGQSLQTNTSTTTAAPSTHLSTLAENNFNDRGDLNENMIMHRAHSYTLSNGFPCTLTGWTHTRGYAKGYLRNRPGTAEAVVSFLQPGGNYTYKVYQYASHYRGNTNSLSVNGGPPMQVRQENSDEPTAEGTAVATADGKITFTFTRQSHHVHLSGIALAGPPMPGITGQPVRPVDLADAGLGVLGGAMSFAFTARWDAPFLTGSRILDFGNGNADSIIVKHAGGGGLEFCVTTHCVTAAAVIAPNEEKSFLVSVTTFGELLIYCNGQLSAELSGGMGAKPAMLDRFHLWIGRSNLPQDLTHIGQIKNFKIFKGMIRWADAFASDALPATPLPPLQPVAPVFMYTGRHFSGNTTDFDDHTLAYDGPIYGAFSFAFSVVLDAVTSDMNVMEIGTSERKIRVGSDASSNLEFKVTESSRHSAVDTSLSASAVGQESQFLCAITSGGQMALYRDGVMMSDRDSGMTPQNIESPLIFGRGFRGSLKSLKFFNRFVRWPQAFPAAASGNRTTLLQMDLEESHWERLHRAEVAASLESVRQTSSAAVEIPYPSDPIVYTDHHHERVSDWMMLRAGEEYPFRLERKVGGRTQDTGPTGWRMLGLECRTLEGHPEMLPRKSELVAMTFKAYPARITVPAWPSGMQFSFRNSTAQAMRDDEVGPALMDLFSSKCSVSPPLDGTNVKGKTWEGNTAAQSPNADAYCGLGALTPQVSPNGDWVLQKEQLSGSAYTLQDYPFLNMCYKLEPGAKANMLVKCRVGRHRREQWFSIGMTIPNFNDFEHDYKRAAQWPLPEFTHGRQDGQWNCASLDLMSSIMAYDDYERRFWHVDYRQGRHNPGDLANMEVMEIWLGTPVKRSGRWQHLTGKLSVDMLLWSKSAVTVTQTQRSLLYPSFPFSNVLGAQTSATWYVRWFSGHGFFGDLQTTQEPVQETFETSLRWNVGGGTKNGLRDNFGFIATNTISFEDGRYKFGIALDDDVAIYVDGQLVARRGCCTGWERWWWSDAFATTAGQHWVEVHFKEGGGGAYVSIAWQKEGTSTVITEPPPATGVSLSHSLDFIPSSRSALAGLEAILQEVHVTFNRATTSAPPMPSGLNVSLPDGLPNTQVTARLVPASGGWVPAYVVTGTGLDKSFDITEAEFNRLFAICPVVRYKRNGRLHSVYVRKTPIPGNFNAFRVFTHTWASAGNQLGQDMDIYSDLAAAQDGRNAWRFCNYDDPGVGYPRDCGPSHHQHGQWFGMPSNGGGQGLWAGASFEIYEGADCISSVAQGRNTTIVEATFDMNDNGTQIQNKLLDAGFPEVDVSVVGRGGLRWLDLRSQAVSMSSSEHGRVANFATDRHLSTEHHHCAQSRNQEDPWWTVQLGGTYTVDSVRVLARAHDGTNYLNGFTVSVDGAACATNGEAPSGQMAEVSCIGGYGSSLTISRPMRGHLIICEVEVAVRDDSVQESEMQDYMVLMSYRQPGDSGPRIALSSPMAQDVQHTVKSNGRRLWSQVTDYWFRMPYRKKQLSLGHWREYICGTQLEAGCAPQPATPAARPGRAGLLQAAEHPSLLVRPPHTPDAGLLAVTSLGRRHPHRRWRAPPRFHTPESLETMRRAVLGTAVRPEGWAGAKALLQEHAGRQKLYDSREAGGEGADPRSDPHALPWSSPSSWGGEQPPNFATADIVYIPEGKTALLDMDVYIRFWVIEGNVVWSQADDIHMEAEAVVVNGGQLLIGSEYDPYSMSGRITLHGHWHSFKLPLFGTKGIFETRGNIEMHGIPRPITWTELETTAYPGDYNITLREPVDWQPGELLIIAASDKVMTDCRIDRRDYCQVEERYVQVNHGASRIITLARPLVYRHVAEELDPKLSGEYCESDPSLCEKTQVRAEVGLLTRNIKVKGSNFMDGSGPAGSEAYGAHIMMAERGQFSYVEFHWMGQASQMGRYPLHFHLTGLNPTSYVKGCALHVTFQRGITVHGTHQAVLKDNVIYNHLSHGYFIEDGNEHDNVFENNLGMMTHISLSMLNSDQTPATFWIRNPSNYFRHNHAAGSASFGFWFDTLSQAAPTLQKQFFNNTAHSNGDTGIWVDIVDSRESCLSPDDWTVSVPFRDTDAISRPVHTNAPSCGGDPRVNFPFLSTTTWGNGVQGITLFETGHLHVLNHRSVSEPIGCKVWGVQSDNFPDETNDWYGPVVRNSVYHSQSSLNTAGFRMDCSIKTPWDDTLFISGVEFIGPVGQGHICPCAECFVVGEGGYQHRTSKLGWHDGAGTLASPKVHFAWQFISFFFDADGTLTEDTPECRDYGCYLHSGFNDGGVFSPRNPTNSTSLLEQGTNTDRERASCMVPLVGGTSSKVIDDAAITVSSFHRNDDSYMEPRIYGGSRWCANHNDANQWIEFDLGTPQFVTAIQTKGDTRHDNWVMSYKVSYSLDGREWIQLQQEFAGNRDRNTMKENRVSPFVAMKLRIEPQRWHRHICLRAEVLGCDAGTGNLTTTCFDRAYLDDDYRNCRDIERSYNNNAAAMQADFCTKYGKFAKFTLLTANQACCACGGGNIHYNINTSHPVTPPEQAPVKFMPKGTAYLDPHKCRVVDGTGGVVCSRTVRMQTVTIKNAGIWHTLLPIDVHSDYGWAETMFANCYQQYEFTVLQDSRNLLIPPYSPTKLWDWDSMNAHITMRKGDRFIIQIETIHNPDGYTVSMPGQTKTAFCDQAPIRYGPGFVDNQTLLDVLRSETDQHSASRLGLDLSLDLYKVAHVPLIDSAWQDNSAANWGYLPANASYVMRWWYPGMLTFMLNDKGVVHGSNHFGAWNGVRRDPMEKMVTRPLASSGGAGFMFSHVHTSFSWSRWDRGATGGGPSGPVGPVGTDMTRLEYLVKVCGMSPAAFKHFGDDVAAALANHSATNASLPSPITVGNILRFNWSQWPAEAGPKPTYDAARDPENMGYGNVTIQPHWEVTLDQDVDFINKLNISGVLKFVDKPGCCKLVARYIMVGAYWGRLEAGTRANPIMQGKAHIVLRGHPMTPHLQSFFPHIRGSAKWMRSKFLAVQGSLSLFGAPRGKIWSKIAFSARAGDTSLSLQGGDFKVGDVVTIDRGLETRKLTHVIPHRDVTEIRFAEPLRNSYHGADHVHLGMIETRGLMAAHVGLVDGHTVIVEGEDTPGAPMCDLNETHRCPYQNGFPRGVSLHDFAKEMRASGGSHPNCRPCGACSEMDYSGYIIAMAHFHRHYNKCPKDHGVVEVSHVAFDNGASMHLYHDYSAGNYPYDVPKDFPGAWSRRPHTWWTDPVWAELNLPDLPTPSHQIEKSSFNNTQCGTAFALATSGVEVFPTLPVSGNVFLSSGVGLNGASRTLREWPGPLLDKAGPLDDNAATRTQGVGSPQDAAEPAGFEKFRNTADPAWHFQDNFLSNTAMTVMAGAVAERNVIAGPVRLQGSDLMSSDVAHFRNNVITAPGQEYCIAMMTGVSEGVSDNTVFGCRVCVGWRSDFVSYGIARRMKLLDCNVGVNYWTVGPDSKGHDMTKVQFTLEDTQIFAKSDGGGIGMNNPKVHSDQLALTNGPPHWWTGGAASFTPGHSSIALYFHSEVRRSEFVGYKKSHGGVALAFGEKAVGDVGDADFHPVFVTATRFSNMTPDSYVRFATTIGAGSGLRSCLQIDCDGLRNSLLVDVDGSLLGSPGTIVPRPQKFYDKMYYVDPLGFDTMEDLIPFPQRYDRWGDAIPFPTGVDHGTGGNLEYECLGNSTQADGRTPGCDVLFMEEGHWLPQPDVPGLLPGTRIVAVREDGGLIRLDALHHGWRYGNGYVRTSDCRLTMHWDPAHGGSTKPESQHARRYGRVNVGEFGTHPNATKVRATIGPVYTKPGIYREGCTENTGWNAFSCPGGKHRHLLLEVMDWNHLDRRWAPVTVEVNDQWAPQGGTLNVLTGPAMMWPGKRVQSFHALGYLGLRHNVYFTADPPKHLRVHLQYAPPEAGVVVCIYYGVPNMVYAYVNGQRKAPLANATPGWDNLVLTTLTPDMPHGTHYYDRVGVETGRPGYLYAVVRGGKYVDFKISHRVQLTTKISVSADWGGWRNASGDNFFNKGLDGLVRNIALLIGAPPSRVKILGEGSAQKGSFWNEDTTSTEFAEWMWRQNQSMAYSPMDHWLSAPGARGRVNATSAQRNASLLHLPRRGQHMMLVQSFAQHRRHIISAALSTEGEAWVNSLDKLTQEEQNAVLELRAQEDLANSEGLQMDNVLNAQKLKEERKALGTPCAQTNGLPCDLPVVLVVDDESYTPESAKPIPPQDVTDAVALAEDASNKAEVAIEGQADQMFLSCTDPSAAVKFTTPEEDRNVTNSTSYPILNSRVDFVPHMNAPLGWMCNADWYEDGSTCHCDCGIWDPDCDLGSIRVPATSYGDSMYLLDKLQVSALMNLVDADGNANGVIDNDELLHLDRRLGLSSLLGVAQRIIEAQEKGANRRSAHRLAQRLGDFAMLEATSTSECGKLFNDAPPLNASLVTFHPMCVRDSEFKTVVGQATGRCSLLPEMKPGSQCMVPGSVGVTGVSMIHNNDTNSSESFVPSAEAVCGTVGRIFRRGQGVGGHRNAGVGRSTAKWTHPGADLLPGTDLAYLDMKALGVQSLDASFRGGFSFYAMVRLDHWEWNIPLFSFGNDLGNTDKIRGAHMTVYTRKEGPGTVGLIVHTGYSTSDWNRHAEKRDLLTVGETSPFLFTVSNQGKIEIYKRGNLVYEHDWRTGQMAAGPFDYMWIGGGGGGAGGQCLWRHCHDQWGFQGMLSDIRIWDSVVTWNEAVAGVPRGSTPEDPVADPSGDLPASCISSRRNTWDFVCDDHVPAEYAEEWGYSGTVDRQAKSNFESREDQGEVVVCGTSNNIKATIFHGRFGDGLTGEYFRMRQDCRPPFLFGQEPALVKVDPAINFQDDIGFRSSFNQYAVRWTGKILIDAGGTYHFKLESKDGSWLSVGGRLVVDNHWCHHLQSREGHINLEKGGIQIAILFFNRGPEGPPTGTVKLRYKGPDTQGHWAQVPQAMLGSAPMRLSKLNRHAQESTDNGTETIRKGSFVYDERTRLGVMPVGSCDLRCRMGRRKAGAAPFKFFCQKHATVSFVATVNQEADNAMIWLDNLPVQTWSLSRGTALNQVQSTAGEQHAEEASLWQQYASSGNHTAAALLSLHSTPPDFIMVPSAASPEFAVTAGEHSFLFQGRAGDDEAFALAGLRFDKGVADCVFFLEGKDKLPEDC